MSIYEGMSLDALQTGMRVASGRETYVPGSRSSEVDHKLLLAGVAVGDAIGKKGQGERVADDVITIGNEPNQFTYARTTPCALLNPIWFGGFSFELYARRRFVLVGSDDARVDELCLNPTNSNEDTAAMVLADWPSWYSRTPRIPAIPQSLQDEYADTIMACARLL